MPVRVLLLSAYDAVSHASWRSGLVAQLTEFDWTVLSLPPRHFSWRARGNALSWAMGEEALQHPGAFDLVVATGMTDFSALRGMAPAVAGVPSLLYMHENQFAYPLSEHNKTSQVFIQSIGLYAACAAEHIAFNSAYNRDSFFSGAATFLKAMPDAVPVNILATLRNRSSVLPVPLPADCLSRDGLADPPPRRRKPPHIIWNHRWEYDKAPERFFAALQILKQRNTDFRLSVLGQQFANAPACFALARKQFAAELVHMGYLPRNEYLRALDTGDVVVSTALHDFQGLAMLEAMARGCVPVAPARVAYAEYIPEMCLYPSTPTDAAVEAQACAGLLDRAIKRIEDYRSLIPDMRSLGWGALGAAYRERLQALLARAQN